MIYFISDGDYVKVGYTDNVDQRLANMSTNNPRTLEIVKLIPGDMSLEYFIHTYFKEYHVRGEWFRYDGSLYRYINNSLEIDFGDHFINLPDSLSNFYNENPQYKELTTNLLSKIGKIATKYKIIKYYDKNRAKYAGFIKCNNRVFCICSHTRYQQCIMLTKELIKNLL